MRLGCAKVTLDDLEAVRTVVSALEGFDAKDQERIIRWAREKLGLSVSTTASPPPQQMAPAALTGQLSSGDPTQSRSTTDIKTFVSDKNPQSDNQFAATVAYYYRFEAPENQRKLEITNEDLQEACRQTGRARLKKPAQTLINARNNGLLDKGSERGTYSINAVGENLVAMTLPAGTYASPSSRKRVVKKNTVSSTRKPQIERTPKTK